MFFRDVLQSLTCHRWTKPRVPESATYGDNTPVEISVQTSTTISRSTSQNKRQSITCTIYATGDSTGAERHVLDSISSYDLAPSLGPIPRLQAEDQSTKGEVLIEIPSSTQMSTKGNRAKTLTIEALSSTSGLPSSLHVENPSLSEMDLAVDSNMDETAKLLLLIEKRLGKQKKLVWTPENSVTQLHERGGIQCGSVLSFNYSPLDFDHASNDVAGPSTCTTKEMVC